MVQKVNDFNVIVVNSEFESLILENSLIKQHQPHYNILLKDDKGYPFIRLDKKAPYPRFTIVGSAKKDGASYFGPFGGRSVTRDIINAASKGGGTVNLLKAFSRAILGRTDPASTTTWAIAAAGAGESFRRRNTALLLSRSALFSAGKPESLSRSLRPKCLKLPSS